MSSPVLNGNKKHHCINQAPNVRYKRRRVVIPAVEKAVCEATSLDIISKSDIGPLMHHEAARNVAKQKPQELKDKSATVETAERSPGGPPKYSIGTKVRKVRSCS